MPRTKIPKVSTGRAELPESLGELWNDDEAGFGVSFDPYDVLYTGRHMETGVEDYHVIAESIQKDLDIKAILKKIIENQTPRNTMQSSVDKRVESAFAAIKGLPRKVGSKREEDERRLDQVALAYYTALVNLKGVGEVKLSKIIANTYPEWSRKNQNQRRTIYVKFQRDLRVTLGERIVRLTAYDGEFDFNGSEKCHSVFDALEKAGLISPSNAILASGSRL